MRFQSRFLIVGVSLLIATIACGGRVFDSIRVYSASKSSIDEVYDISSDTILTENIWVFRPDGTFKANLIIDSQDIALSGTYEGDDVGSVFYFSLDFDGDGSWDDRVKLDVENDQFRFIDWEYAGSQNRFWLAE